ncbi:hypothetical protein P3T25_005563 [Paraburkholderia sp. GAS32]
MLAKQLRERRSKRHESNYRPRWPRSPARRPVFTLPSRQISQGHLVSFVLQRHAVRVPLEPFTGKEIGEPDQTGFLSRSTSCDSCNCCYGNALDSDSGKRWFTYSQMIVLHACPVGKPSGRHRGSRELCWSCQSATKHSKSLSTSGAVNSLNICVQSERSLPRPSPGSFHMVTNFSMFLRELLRSIEKPGVR